MPQDADLARLNMLENRPFQNLDTNEAAPCTYGITPSMSGKGKPYAMQWRKISSLF